MQREHIIQALVVDCLVSIFDRNQYCWLQGILENGFRGFTQMSTEELLLEMKHRNLDFSPDDSDDNSFEIDACDLGSPDIPCRDCSDASSEF